MQFKAIYLKGIAPVRIKLSAEPKWTTFDFGVDERSADETEDS